MAPVSLTVVLPTRPTYYDTQHIQKDRNTLFKGALICLVLLLLTSRYPSAPKDMALDLIVLFFALGIWGGVNHLRIVLVNREVYAWEVLYRETYQQENRHLRANLWKIQDFLWETLLSGDDPPQAHLLMTVTVNGTKQKLIIPRGNIIFDPGTSLSQPRLSVNATIRFRYAEYDETTGLPNLNIERGVIIYP